MKLVVINPNTSATMTEDIATAARAVASNGTQIVALNPVNGPVSIEGHHDDVYAAVGVLDCIRMPQARDADGYVIACGNDPGLFAARETTTAPVLGIGEAAMQTAVMLGGHFTVITTLRRTNIQLEENVLRYGMRNHCRAVKAVDLPVLDLHGDEAYEKLRGAIAATIVEDGAETIVLACAGMAAMARRLSEELLLPVIDGVQAATRLVEAVSGLRLSTSKINSFAPPLPKEYLGHYADLSPEKSLK